MLGGDNLLTIAAARRNLRIANASGACRSDADSERWVGEDERKRRIKEKWADDHPLRTIVAPCTLATRIFGYAYEW